MPSIRSVLFDLGGTLCSEDEAIVPSLLGVAVQAVHRYGLAAAPGEVVQAMIAAFGQVLPGYVEQPFYLMADLNAAVFRRALAGFDVRLSDEEALAMHREWSCLAGARLVLFEGVLETLAALRERGVTTGIVSLSDDAELTEAVAALGLRDAVDFVLSTEAARSCKPHAAIFEEALRRAGCSAADALFVGNMPPMDIAGANRVGMTSVLLLTATELPGHGSTTALEGDLKPDHIIRSIPEVLGLLR